MPRLRIWTLLALALLCQVAASSAPAAQERPGRQLIRHLKAIADAGRLTDAAFVGKTLGMRFTGRSERSSPIAGTCAPGLTKRDGVTTFYTESPGLALQATQFGRASIVRPGFGTINSESGTVSGTTRLTYYVTENHDCSGYISASNAVVADLSIGPISTYDCITPGELRGWLPQAQDAYATDGAIVSYYTGKNGAVITFNFFVGTPCLLAVSFRQDPADTPRYRAAAQDQAACMLPHEAKFCAAHAPFDWGAGDVQDEMARFAVAKCGSFDAFLKRTRPSARPRESLLAVEADPGRSTPCSMVQARLAALK